MERISGFSDVEPSKSCARCRRWLPLVDFKPSQFNGSVGRFSYCGDCDRARRLERTYGITLEERAEWAKDGCMICGTHASLVVDHSHATGEARGVLCHRDNILLGFLETTSDKVLLAAFKYLGRPLAAAIPSD